MFKEGVGTAHILASARNLGKPLWERLRGKNSLGSSSPNSLSTTTHPKSDEEAGHGAGKQNGLSKSASGVPASPKTESSSQSEFGPVSPKLKDEQTTGQASRTDSKDSVAKTDPTDKSKASKSESKANNKKEGKANGKYN